RRRVAGKRFTWMVYVASVAARFRCPADLLILTLDPKVARWARRPGIAIRRAAWSPLVIGPEEIPEVVDVEEAKRSPERALLSWMAHGSSADLRQVVRLGDATVHALEVLEQPLQELYWRMMERALGDEGARALEAYMDSHGEQLGYFSRKFEAARKTAIEEGRQEGRQEGRREMVIRALERRFGPLTEAHRARVLAFNAS